MLRDFWYGIKNVVRWTPVIWRDADFDWDFLAQIMEYKLRRMAKCFDEYGHHIGSKRDAKECRMAAELLKRLQEDRYFWNAGYDPKTWETKSDREKTHICKHADLMAQQDLKCFGDLFVKKLRNWWD